MIREAIAALADGRRPTRAEACAVMLEIMSGDATPAQIAAYITALRIRGETADVIAGSAEAMRRKFTAVDAGGGIVADTCGTGGDGAHTARGSRSPSTATAASPASAAAPTCWPRWA